MKKCSSCGATYNDSTNFCSSCGTRLTAVSAQRSRHPGHKKKQHRLIGRLAVPAVVLILVLSTVFIFFYRKEYKPLIVDHNPSVYTYEDLVSDTDLLKSRYSSVFSADSLGETADGGRFSILLSEMKMLPEKYWSTAVFTPGNISPVSLS